MLLRGWITNHLRKSRILRHSVKFTTITTRVNMENIVLQKQIIRIPARGNRFNSSLIISTYNLPEALSLCLQSFLLLKVLPDEVIIADDGSEKETKKIIDKFVAISPVPVKHIWQPDYGFRLAKIRNKAIAAANGDYIIQIDGDIIMHPFFIADHLRFAKKNSVVRASRTYISEQRSEIMLAHQSAKINFSSRGTANSLSAIRLPLLWPLFETSYKNKGDERFEIHGCNMAFWKDDFIKVNGYNEAFLGWGPEDKELVARLLNIGVQKRFLKLGAIAFHLYHPENKKENLYKNEYLLKEAIVDKTLFCKSGINKYIVNG
jgi:glycosyltransferase involved in cell wall biosynthesis